METLEDVPPKKDSWRGWLLLALVLSLAGHAALYWWAARLPVNIFSDSYYDKMVPRAFQVDRVEIDARLLEEDPADLTPPSFKRTLPAPVQLPEESIAEEAPELRFTPKPPSQLGLAEEPAPQIGLSATASAEVLKAATASAFDEDLQSVREALLAESSSAATQPALELAAAAGRAGAAGDESVPSGYSNLDELLGQAGGLSPSQAPIFMPADVLFGYDEFFLRPEAISSLEKLGELIRRNPQARFRIEGHTDSFGGADYNTKLSLARAESVKQWLASRMAIDPARIDTLGLGNTKPLVPAGGSIEEQKLNRRVEIVILRAAGGS